MNDMNFGQAIEQLKLGNKVCREGWNGKNMFLFLVPGSRFEVNRPPLLGTYPPEGTADNKVIPWLASQADILSDDWMMAVDYYLVGIK